MAETAPGAPPAAGNGRRTLILIAALVLAPLVAAYVAYYFFPREQRINYGTLLPTGPAPAIGGTRDDGSPFRLEDLRGRWVLLATSRGDCDAACERKLYATRQARTMQGPDRDRVVRALVLVGDGKAGAALLAVHPDLVIVRAVDSASAALPEGARPIYLIDPLGNLVLFYAEDPDIRGIASDLARLLKASRIG
jgi:hypothetical protein